MFSLPYWKRKEEYVTNLDWVEPDNIVAGLKEQRNRLCLLQSARRDLPPLANGWLKDLDELIKGLEKYAEGCRQKGQQIVAPPHRPVSTHPLAGEILR
jgi:hypothetical protein